MHEMWILLSPTAILHTPGSGKMSLRRKVNYSEAQNPVYNVVRDLDVDNLRSTEIVCT